MCQYSLPCVGFFESIWFLYTERYSQTNIQIYLSYIMKNYLFWFLSSLLLCGLIISIFFFSKSSTEITQDNAETTNNTNSYGIIDIQDFYDIFTTQWYLTNTTYNTGEQFNPYHRWATNPIQLGATYSIGTGWYRLGILHANVLILNDNSVWWKPRFTIYDGADLCHRWNRPTGFLQQGNTLLMSIVDKCGGWSGEWHISVYELLDNAQRSLKSCYNYDRRDPFQELAPVPFDQNRYDRWTLQFSSLPELPLSICKGNIRIEYYL